MKSTMTINRPLLLATLGALLVPAAGCLPASGSATVYGDGAPKTADGAPRTDRKLLLADGTPAKNDRGGAPPPDLGKPPPTPDTAGPPPSGPQPPFGSALGMTATNFTGIPDCAGKLYNLHSYYNQKKGVVLAMFSPS